MQGVHRVLVSVKARGEMSSLSYRWSSLGNPEYHHRR